jgi:plastocyanin
MSAQTTPSKGMGRTIAIVLVVVVVIIAVLGYYLLSGMGSGNTTTSPLKSNIGIPSGTNSNSSLNFSPSSIKVVIGVNNTITWTNNDNAAHTITFTSAPSGVSTSSLTDPNNLNAGGTYSVTLTAPGTYQYHCTIHSWMQGTITVLMAA